MHDDVVVLRKEHGRGWSRHLEARLDPDGTLSISGHDLGGDAAIISPDAEYEWHETIAPTDVARLVTLLGGMPGEPILDVLSRRYTGDGAGEFERILRESGIDTHLWTWT